jgi:hypothetical protein
MAEGKIKDFPRDMVIEMAESAIEKNGGPEKAKVFFKFYCEVCGGRCTFNEPNELFETGICYKCGHETVVNEAGFMVIIEDRNGRRTLTEAEA